MEVAAKKRETEDGWKRGNDIWPHEGGKKGMLGPWWLRGSRGEGIRGSHCYHIFITQT